MYETYSCEICGNQARIVHEDRDYGSLNRACLHCPCCGKFWLKPCPIPQETKVKLSAWIREQNLLNETPEIDAEQIQRIATKPIPRHLERADRILIHLVRHQKSLDEIISYDSPELQALSYSKNLGEVEYLVIEFLVAQGFVKREHKHLKITFQGHKRYDELHAREAASTQGFVAMWFDDSMQDAYEKGFKAGILKAGYDPVRIDGVEHAEKIDDRIIAEIRRSKFLVADFTGHRGGVYFEAGFALGLNLQVIWTCHKDDLKDLHFDIRQYNCIDWTEPSDLAERLKNRIGAVIGMGPRDLFNQE